MNKQFKSPVKRRMLDCWEMWDWFILINLERQKIDVFFFGTGKIIV